MVTTPVSERTTCRMCGGKTLAPLLSLGDLVVSGFVDDDAEDVAHGPLDLVRCERGAGGCGLVQLRHTVSSSVMYTRYWYRSGTNEAMRRALADITAHAESVVDLRAGDFVLDIGCNDGTLLRSYRTRGLRLCGFEPAKNVVELARRGTHHVTNDFFNAAAFRDAFGAEKARVITSIAMFYDLEDPNAFVADLAACLDDNGIWINQMASLPLMLETNAFDNICHEHLEYYSLAVLVDLYARHGLEVFDVVTNDVNGGSFRVLARKKGASVGTVFGAARVDAMLHMEARLGLDTAVPYQAFVSRVTHARDTLMAFLRQAKADGKRVYGYGASTKGNTLLQYYGIDASLVAAIAERAPEKWGKRTAGTNIPIISEEQARIDKPDYFLILPWHFLPAFREREQAFLAAGGSLLVPLPEVRVVGG